MANPVSNISRLEIDLSESDISLVGAASPRGGGGGGGSASDDDTVTVRSDDEAPSRTSSASRSVTFGQNISLRSMRPVPNKQQSQSTIGTIESQSTIEAAREAGLSRHVLERRPTDPMENLSGPESEVEEPVATPVAAAGGPALASPPSLAVGRDPNRIKGVLKSSLRTKSEGPAPAPARRPRLSTRSQQYDLDGDGVLNAEERAMMESDQALNTRDRETKRTTKGAPKTSKRPGASTSRPKLNQLFSRGNSGPTSSGTSSRRPRLTTVSRRYDLDGDGVLDAIEQAMRDRDVNNDGQLDNREVHDIIRDQLKSEEDYGLYRRWAMGLTCLVFILALSNFGTSWASALLAKDTRADAESGAINSKRTGETMGLQATSDLIDVEELSEYEFEQRRLLVDAEMAEDPDHPDHAHRRLGRNKNNNNACRCTKMAYDIGKVEERDLMELTKKCDGARTVQMRRTWRNRDIMDTRISTDYDIICEPGTQVKKRGKKKNNKKKTKTKVVDSFVEFKTKGKDGKDRVIAFDCDKGKCFTSGALVHQRAGHPCKIERDLAGASECQADLACYDPDDHLARRGAGICTELQEYAGKGQICDVTHGVNACKDDYVCYQTGKGLNARISVGTVSTGICRPAEKFARLGEVCGAAFGKDACDGEFLCLTANGRTIRRGVGRCQKAAPRIDKLAKRNRECNFDFGDKACVANHACYPQNGDLFNARGRTRICQFVGPKVREGGVCNASYRDACVAGHMCLGENGCDNEEGFGVCQKVGRWSSIVKFAQRNEECDFDFDDEACVANHACFPRNGGLFDTRGRTRICQFVDFNVRKGGVCNTSYGADACRDGYECLGENGRAIRAGFGVCQNSGRWDAIVKFAEWGEACDFGFGDEACVANHACYALDGDFFDTRRGRARVCQFVGPNVGPGGVCDASNNLGACINGYECLDENGRAIRAGFGVCQNSERWDAIVKFAEWGEACDFGFGDEACVANHACYAWDGDFFDTRRGRARVCQFVGRNSGLNEVCDASYGANACATGYKCLDEILRPIWGGFGVCVRRGRGGGGVNKSGGCSGSGACLPAGASWAVDCTDTCSCVVGTCLKNCVPGSDRWFCYQ